jgi:hypothetical protein
MEFADNIIYPKKQKKYISNISSHTEFTIPGTGFDMPKEKATTVLRYLYS